MKIVTLVENTTLSDDYRSKHGLSFYIETAKHKILFDLGQDDLFIKNSVKMNIDLTKIDTVIISHGHKDHGGALKEFMKINSTAKIYVKKEAFESHYIKVFGLFFNIGLNKKLQYDKQIILVGENLRIDDELFLFSNVKPVKFTSQSNRKLYSKKQDQILLDDFSHEQSMIITSDERSMLISGCSHTGIINILNEANKLVLNEISVVVGGFHLYNPPTRKYENDELIIEIAEALKEKTANYYTCHCTGNKAYKLMKTILGDRLTYLATGSQICI